MTTDNTQEHMHNSGEATSYAQRSAQAELDDAPDLSDTHTIVDIPGFGKVWAVNNITIYYDTWLDWHNKQVEKLLYNPQPTYARSLKNLGEFLERYNLDIGLAEDKENLKKWSDAIQAERNKLMEEKE